MMICIHIETFRIYIFNLEDVYYNSGTPIHIENSIS